MFILAYSTDPDEMSYFVAFHLGLHSLPKVPIYGFPVVRVKIGLSVSIPKDGLSRLYIVSAHSLYFRLFLHIIIIIVIISVFSGFAHNTDI